MKFFELMTFKYKFSKFLIKSLLSAAAFSFISISSTSAEGVAIKNYGHSSLLIKGESKSILLNPFRAVGCAQGLSEPKITVDIILASSELADEGAKVAKGIFFVEPGSYDVDGLKIEGFSLPHDRLGGRRFGQSTVWVWELGGLNFAHMGGSVAPLNLENKLLLGSPDILIIPVGGGAKVYNAVEAKELIEGLKPKVVIPVQYTRKKSYDNCDQDTIEPFLKEMELYKVKKVGKSLRISNKFRKDDTTIYIMGIN